MLDPKKWFKNLFVRGIEPAPKPKVNPLKPRESRAAESLLENEALTAALDDTAAKVLLDWGVACAKMIAQSTAGLDDLEAEEAMAPRLRAIRRFMRLVNQWIPKRAEMSGEDSRALWAKMAGQVVIIYGRELTSFTDVQWDMFLQHSQTVHPSQAIENLRVWIENLFNHTDITLEETHDQEKYNN
ncbi:MAG: hypothetical protein JXA33_08590 [Anaerolineae bacterium]|nr:hypothetical protein [Anaerolineae bacterium]